MREKPSNRSVYDLPAWSLSFELAKVSSHHIGWHHFEASASIVAAQMVVHQTMPSPLQENLLSWKNAVSPKEKAWVADTSVATDPSHDRAGCLQPEDYQRLREEVVGQV